MDRVRTGMCEVCLKVRIDVLVFVWLCLYGLHLCHRVCPYAAVSHQKFERPSRWLSASKGVIQIWGRVMLIHCVSML